MKFWPMTGFAIIMLIVAGVVLKQSNTQVAFVSPIPTPVPTIVPTQGEPPKVEVWGWVPWWEGKRAVETIMRAGSKLDGVSPAWYTINDKGELDILGKKQDQQLVELQIARQRLPVVALIGNDFDPVRVSKLFDSEQLQKAFIDKMIIQAKIKGYKGWDFDFEEVAASDVTRYVDFLHKTKEKFTDAGLLLSVTVHAKNGQKEWEGSLGHDYKALGEVADWVRLMAYDFHSAGSQPGPVTPLDKLAETLQYAKDTIPAEKIVLGLPTYGYDWGKDKGKSVLYEDAVAIMNKYKVNAQRDGKSGALTVKYKDDEGVDHEMWFEDGESTQKKIELAKLYGVYKYVFWSLAGEDPEMWKEF